MSGRTARILLIEDNDDHAELVLRALEDHHRNPEVTRLPDGAAALEYFERASDGSVEHPRPDLVLLDLRLPRVDGIDVLRRIKRSPTLGTMPVIVLSSSAAARDMGDAYDSRVNAYLVKPIDFDGLEDMLRDTGSFWLDWNRSP